MSPTMEVKTQGTKSVGEENWREVEEWVTMVEGGGREWGGGLFKMTEKGGERKWLKKFRT